MDTVKVLNFNPTGGDAMPVYSAGRGPIGAAPEPGTLALTVASSAVGVILLLLRKLRFL